PEQQPRDYPSSLIAWDPINQKEAWSIPQDDFWNGGTLTTAGNLLFQGRTDGMLLAYNATSGDIVWEFDAGLGISAPPITYKIDGRQYIVVLVGWGGIYASTGGQDAYDKGWAYGVHQRRLISFSLDGNAKMPALPEPFFPQPIILKDFEIDEALANLGAEQYYANRCSGCHGGGGISGGTAPDLRASVICTDKEAFTTVVKEGSKIEKGMPQYKNLTDEKIAGLMLFIRYLANSSIAEDEL
ncbi:MAG: PQQ-binding-like beta-propeller repeat protein, partial [Pricia sp.]|nr:PQQ-binding-like beta-propeller repeat protein [Pricia sp.]